MKLLIADETNNEPNDNIKFFLYGGIVVDSSKVQNISNAIRALRKEYGVSGKEKIKFNLQSCPSSITREQHTEIKNRVLEIAQEFEVSVIINCVLHDIARNKEKHELVAMTSATVFRRFNQFCYESDTPGLVLADRWPTPDGFGFLESCQFEGIEYNGGEKVDLPWVHGYAQVSDNSTTLMSVADIVLGAFRYCINERDKTIVNSNLMPKIARLMWSKKIDGKNDVTYRGLNVSPRDIQVNKYKDEYDSLIDHIIEYANTANKSQNDNAPSGQDAA